MEPTGVVVGVVLVLGFVDTGGLGGMEGTATLSGYTILGFFYELSRCKKL